MYNKIWEFPEVPFEMSFKECCRFRVASTEAAWLSLVGNEWGESEPRVSLVIVLGKTVLWDTIKE